MAPPASFSDPAIRAAVRTLLARLEPRAVLALGEDAATALGVLDGSALEVVELAPDGTLPALSRTRHGDVRYDLALAGASVWRHPRATTEPLVARLRNLQATVTCLLAPQEDALDWSTADLVALGFSRVAADLPLYLHDVSSYKRTPDWLNAGGWANPERWDKERW